MIEHAHLLDDRGYLSGVVTQPDTPSPAQPALIMLNAGFLHHIGPYRLHTQLARELAAQGFTSLRFDLGGVGDSPDSPHKLADSNAQAIADVGTAMDFLQSQYQIGQFILMGLCSGADDAFDVAVADPRVCGTILIDGHGFRTRRFYLNHIVLHFGRRLFSVQKWRTLLARLSSPKAGDDRSAELEDRIREDTPKEQVCASMRDLAGRGCRQRFIYTGGVSDYYNYEKQFVDCFGDDAALPGISYRWFPDSDHLFTLARHRESLRQDLIQWIRSEFAAAA
ncbi:alpha/beta hydrolase [Granulosicoccaceae sp. 1_MG-2023]|nr:alpha/beta hydrolase [Granulosicoccaceae sp. 1_MG-2023]